MIVEGAIFPLERANIDTDQIIPGKYLGGGSRAEMGEHCFSGVAEIAALYAAYPRATIVVARENFGCGSSREHAVWALQGRGFAAVIAPSFARIFEENAYNNGFIPAVVDESDIELLLAATNASIDVAAQRIVLSTGESVAFALDPLRKEFIQGGGFLAYMHAHIPTIRAFERERITLP